MNFEKIKYQILDILFYLLVFRILFREQFYFSTEMTFYNYSLNTLFILFSYYCYKISPKILFITLAINTLYCIIPLIFYQNNYYATSNDILTHVISSFFNIPFIVGCTIGLAYYFKANGFAKICNIFLLYLVLNLIWFFLTKSQPVDSTFWGITVNRGNRFHGFLGEPSQCGFMFFGILFTLPFFFQKKQNKTLLFLIIYLFILLVIKAKFVSLETIFLPIIFFIIKPKLIIQYKWLILSGIILATLFKGYESIIIDLFSGRNDADTFIARFGYIICSLKHLWDYPLGVGNGGWLETYYPYIQDYHNKLINAGVHSFEMDNLKNYQLGTKFMPTGHDTLSALIIRFGFLGLFVFFFFFYKLIKISLKLSKNYQLLVLGLFFSLIIHINIFDFLIDSAWIFLGIILSFNIKINETLNHHSRL